MSISVNANRSALNALQTLARGAGPEAAQSRSAAPQKNAPDRDTASGAGVRPQIVSLAQMKRSLDRAASISDVALSAGQTVSDVLDQLRQQAEADGEGASVAARVRAALRQIEHVVQKASFDGVNLLDGSLGEDLRITLDGGSEAVLSPRDLRPGGGYVTLTGGEGDDTAAIATSTINVSSALADLRIQGRQIESHARFVSRLGEALVTDQVDGDLSKESARLHALQIQQQLSGERLSIANQAPQLVLQLFRG